MVTAEYTDFLCEKVYPHVREHLLKSDIEFSEAEFRECLELPVVSVAVKPKAKQSKPLPEGVKTCQYVFKKGLKEGQKCGKACKPGTDHCASCGNRASVKKDKGEEVAPKGATKTAKSIGVPMTGFEGFYFDEESLIVFKEERGKYAALAIKDDSGFRRLNDSEIDSMTTKGFCTERNLHKRSNAIDDIISAFNGGGDEDQIDV